MNAEILIKARKVFVEPVVEFTETCPYCASRGIDNKLRYYYISLEEAIYKCAGSTCLYPFERFIFKSLTDNSVYYYEEVREGREAIFRVALDDQPSFYQSNTPLSTKEFCDSQRNPNIECYNGDFSDLLNDFESEPLVEQQSASESNPTASVNPDFLAFLDDITPADLNADKVLDENGVDDLIKGLLTDSPAKNTTPAKPTAKNETTKKNKSKTVAAPKVKTEAKLSKCIQHIEKTKSTKSQKGKEKPVTESFSMAIQKARKSRAKNKTDKAEASPEKIESTSEAQPQSEIVPEQEQSKTPQKSTTKKLNTTLKCVNNVPLRPTALAKQLSSMDFTKIDSNFLRQYMKTKEDKLFEGEPSSVNENGGQSNTSVESSIERPAHMRTKKSGGVKCETVTSASIVDANKPTNSKEKVVKKAARKKPIDQIEAKNDKSGGSSKEENVLCTSRTSRSSKKDGKSAKVKEEKSEKCSPSSAVLPMEEPVSKTKSKEEKPLVKSPRKRASASRKKVTEPQIITDTEKKDVNGKGTEEPKQINKRARKQVTSTITSGEYLKEIAANNTTIDDGSNLTIELETKSRKRRSAKKSTSNDVPVKVENDDTKQPKRKRLSKPAKNAKNDELPSLPSILIDDTASESKSDIEITLIQSSNRMPLPSQVICSSKDVTGATISSANQKCCEPVVSLPSDAESEGSQTEFGGFSRPLSVESVKRRMKFVEVTEPPPPVLACPVKKPTKRQRTTKIEPEGTANIKSEPADDSSECGSSPSKRPRARKTLPKSKGENQAKDPRRESKSQRSTAAKNKTELTTEQPQLSADNVSADPSKIKENAQQNNVAFDMPIETDKSIPQQPSTNSAPNDTIVPTEVAKKENEPWLPVSSVNENRERLKSTAKSQQPYYQPKKFKKEIEKTFKVDSIIDDWNDSESEQTNEQQMVVPESLEIDDTASIITITSENSDTDLTLIGYINYCESPSADINFDELP